jgi:hypothetical protein
MTTPSVDAATASTAGASPFDAASSRWLEIVWTDAKYRNDALSF